MIGRLSPLASMLRYSLSPPRRGVEASFSLPFPPSRRRGFSLGLFTSASKPPHLGIFAKEPSPKGLELKLTDTPQKYERAIVAMCTMSSHSPSGEGEI